MIVLKFGSTISEKIIGKGNFICPLCHRKRQYKRYKIVKKAFYAIISTSDNVGEFIQCESCLRPFPLRILESGIQLKMEIENISLPPSNMMDIWQKAYKTLNCEDIIANKKEIVEIINPVLFTMAHHMQDAGVKLRLQDYEEARKYLITIVNLGFEWQESNIKYNLQVHTKTPKTHNKIIEYMTFSHILLSRLP
jgi:hypothetical protein